MAEKRMFAKTIIDSDAFIDMPVTARLLYYDLAMRADDDGFVNSPKRIMRTIGASQDDLTILILRKFIIPFDNGIVVIKHWRIHNYIRKDTYNPTTYTEQKDMLELDENKAYKLRDCEDATGYIEPVDGTLTQIRLDKIRLDKGRLESEGKPSPPTPINQKHKYGEFKHVLLTDEQHEALVNDYGEQKLDEYIRKVDEYCEQTGKKYKNYLLTIRNWIRKDKPEQMDVSGSPDEILMKHIGSTDF
jgi:hypothetical protein